MGGYTWGGALRACPRRNNVLRRFIFPACDSSGLQHATWLTFRRTYSSWAHDKNVPAKVIAELMGHANVYTTLNVYTQGCRTLSGPLRTESERNCSKLFSFRKRSAS